VSQDYLLEARQMQAMSFAIHIPLVCFAIALPSLVVFIEWLHLRTGDPVYRTLARRWSKVMISLLAVGVVTGTVLSFELGLLWPAFRPGSATSSVSPLRPRVLVLCRGDLHRHLRLRLGPALAAPAPAVRDPRGHRGLCRLAVRHRRQRLDEPPRRLRAAGRQRGRRRPFSALFANSFFWHELIHMYLGGFIVTGFAIAAAYAWGWLRGRRGRYHC
jgi:cytochrome bd ubiquinol oxidase subunit I